MYNYLFVHCKYSKNIFYTLQIKQKKIILQNTIDLKDGYC